MNKPIEPAACRADVLSCAVNCQADGGDADVGQALTPIPVEVLGGCVMLADGVDVEKLANSPL